MGKALYKNELSLLSLLWRWAYHTLKWSTPPPGEIPRKVSTWSSWKMDVSLALCYKYSYRIENECLPFEAYSLCCNQKRKPHYCYYYYIIFISTDFWNRWQISVCVMNLRSCSHIGDLCGYFPGPGKIVTVNSRRRKKRYLLVNVFSTDLWSWTKTLFLNLP